MMKPGPGRARRCTSLLIWTRMPWADLREDKLSPVFLADFRHLGAHGGPREPWDGLRLENSAGCAKNSPGNYLQDPFVGTSCLWCRPQKDKKINDKYEAPKVRPVPACRGTSSGPDRPQEVNKGKLCRSTAVGVAYWGSPTRRNPPVHT